jgi:hypothetical protein
MKIDDDGMNHKLFVGLVVASDNIDEIVDMFVKYPARANAFIFNHIRLKNETPPDIWQQFNMDRYFIAGNIASEITKNTVMRDW